MHTVFAVEKAAPSQLRELDVQQWPIWTTAGNPKWVEGQQNTNKVMPYGELSYVLQGKLEIIPQETGERTVVEKGDFVTFPRGFVADWRVLEEITWHYYLY